MEDRPTSLQLQDCIIVAMIYSRVISFPERYEEQMALRNWIIPSCIFLATHVLRDPRATRMTTDNEESRNGTASTEMQIMIIVAPLSLPRASRTASDATRLYEITFRE
jgi:hypothetical protein